MTALGPIAQRSIGEKPYIYYGMILAYTLCLPSSNQLPLPR